MRFATAGSCARAVLLAAWISFREVDAVLAAFVRSTIKLVHLSPAQVHAWECARMHVDRGAVASLRERG